MFLFYTRRSRSSNRILFSVVLSIFSFLLHWKTFGEPFLGAWRFNLIIKLNTNKSSLASTVPTFFSYEVQRQLLFLLLNKTDSSFPHSCRVLVLSPTSPASVFCMCFNFYEYPSCCCILNNNEDKSGGPTSPVSFR